ncbi:MAG TPA: hypothetical protein VFM76_09185 [Methylophaga sp.]|nr:hypothetical protein [Methylophaga sp.]
MTSLLPSFRYLIISLLLLAFMMPAAQADVMTMSEPASHEQTMDCHEAHAVQSDHQHSTDCAQSCDCAATGCHVNAALAQQHQAATSTIILNTLTALSEHTVSQSPAKFERPPRS